MSKSTNTATAGGPFISLYERRLQMIIDTIQAHAKMSDKSANKLAIAVLHAIDHVPERVR